MTQILFINASRLGVMVTRVLRDLQKDEIQKIIEAVLSFRNGHFQAEAGFSASATIEDIQSNSCILSAGRYVEQELREKDSEPFEEKMNRLASELNILWKKSDILENQIRNNLEKLGIKFEG